MIAVVCPATAILTPPNGRRMLFMPILLAEGVITPCIETPVDRLRSDRSHHDREVAR